MAVDYEILMIPFHQRLEPLVKQPEDLSVDAIATAQSPQALLRVAYIQMMTELCEELFGFIQVQTPQFFETLIIDVMLALGYGSRGRDVSRRLGRSGDGGIDGVIEMDELGLDVIYLQAKRLRPGTTVAVSAVRDFVGSLGARHAAKGIFVTTGRFSPAALAVVEAVSKKIILIDGQKLTELMIRHNVGIVPADTLQFKKIDRSYFSKSTGIADNNFASSQFRR